jgi:hypothetical protein
VTNCMHLTESKTVKIHRPRQDVRLAVSTYLA